VSGKHKVTRGKHRAAARLAGKHRKPSPGLNALSEKTGMLAVTGVVAASTTLGGAMTVTHRGSGSVQDEASASPAPGPDDPAVARAAARADRGVARAALGAPTRTPARAPSPAATRPTAGPTVAAKPAASPVRTTPITSRTRVKKSPEPPDPPPQSRAVTCKASFYDEPQDTASGERFDPDALTAAHRSLPMGSRVLVTNLANGESVTVRINDRGPFVPGRCLDLSRAAFDDIADLDQGVARVQYRVL
jgi:rare lipoprotein A